MSTGAPLNLTLEPTGTVGWGSAVNANFTSLNTAIAALQAGGSSGPAGAAGAPGAVGIIWAGPWGSGTPYVATDAVSFNGSSYLALAPSTGVQPDTHPSTWALLALAGATGPIGPEGPAGSGTGGSTVTFPITVAEGGTGAADPFNARVNLGAAASNINGDITELTAIACGTSQDPTTTGITIRSAGGDGTAISVGNGSVFGGITSGGGVFASYIACLGQINCANIICSGNGVQSHVFAESTAGQGMGFIGQAVFQEGIVIEGPTPVVASGLLGIGTSTSSTASPGGGQTVPATVLGFLVFNDGGTKIGIPFFAIP
jgi:hypothetical protein